MRGKYAALILLVACCGGQTRVVQYAPPMPRPGDRPPPVVSLDDVSPPFQRRTDDVVDHDVLPVFSGNVDAFMAAPAVAKNAQVSPKGATEKDPHLVIAEGKREADTVPEDGDTSGNTHVYQYDRDRSFRVYGCYKEPVEIMFAPGERVVESMGDKKEERPVRLVKGWDHGFTESGDGLGHVVQVMVLKPISDDTGLRKLNVHTSVGPYTFLLEVLPRDETRCMDRVRFRHPKRELEQLLAEDEQRSDVAKKAAADGCTSANYEIEVLEGSPRWVPTLVWRTCDGEHARVHIQFRGDVAWSKIPALKTDGGVVDYRYVPEDHVIVVDGLFTRAQLALGSKEQGYERVSIRALKDAR